MPLLKSKIPLAVAVLKKCPTGIQGLDEITGGGLPLGRPTLVCGSAGCGKTLLAMEFLVHGARDLDEPGVFVSFEEPTADLIKNFASLGFDLNGLTARRKLTLDYIYIERSEIEETGEYDLGGLFIRLEQALDEIGARRVVSTPLRRSSPGSPTSLFYGLSCAVCSAGSKIRGSPPSSPVKAAKRP